MNMNDYINELYASMKSVRERSEKISAWAYDLRQKALRLQFEATAAIETADVATEILKECNDPILLKVVVKSSLEATQNAAETTLKAIVAVEEANEADKEVTETFLVAKEAAEKLADALNKITEEVDLAN
jgi:hypothetical protein